MGISQKNYNFSGIINKGQIITFNNGVENSFKYLRFFFTKFKF